MATVITNGNTNLSRVCTMTLANPCVVTFKTNGRAQTEGRVITFSTDGALPATIVAGTTYYVRNPSGNTFNLSGTVDGALLDTSADSQSGTHKIAHAFDAVVRGMKQGAAVQIL